MLLLSKLIYNISINKNKVNIADCNSTDKGKLSVETQLPIFKLWQEKNSIRQIAKKIKISTSMGWNIIKKKEETENAVNGKKNKMPGNYICY